MFFQHISQMWNTKTNKTVLLRECKRHTACRVASTHSAGLSRGGGTPSLTGGIPSLAGGYLISCGGGYLGGDLGPVSRVPPGKDMGPVEVLWDGQGVPHPRVDRHIPVKTVPSRRITHACGNEFKRYLYQILKMLFVADW